MGAPTEYVFSRQGMTLGTKMTQLDRFAATKLAAGLRSCTGFDGRTELVTTAPRAKREEDEKKVAVIDTPGGFIRVRARNLEDEQAGGRCEGSPLRSQSGSTRTTQRAAPAGACWLTVSTLGMLAVVFGHLGDCRRLHSQLGCPGGRRRKQLTSRLHCMAPFALQRANQI